jgi:hypothetical protein
LEYDEMRAIKGSVAPHFARIKIFIAMGTPILAANAEFRLELTEETD